MTTPTEFVLWLNGAASVMGEAPTPEQWEAIKEKMNESLGFLAAKKLLERAEDQIVRDREIEANRKEEAQMAKLQAAKSMFDSQLRQQKLDREKVYPGVIKRPNLIGDPLLIGAGEPVKVMGLYDPALSSKALLASCVSDKSDDLMDAMAMAVNYAKEAK